MQLSAVGRQKGKSPRGWIEMRKVLEVPYFPQETDDTCAPACLRMVLAYAFPDGKVAESQLASECETIEDLGTAVSDAQRVARERGLSVKLLDDERVEDEIQEALQADRPVIANVTLVALPYWLTPVESQGSTLLQRAGAAPAVVGASAGAAGPNTGPDSADSWHAVVVVGLDDENIYLHDPQAQPRQIVDRMVFFADWVSRLHIAYRV